MEHSDRIYKRVLGTIEMQTDNQYQGPWCPVSTVVSHLARHYGADRIREELERAVEAGDLHHDAEADRYQLADGVSRWENVGTGTEAD